MKDKLFWFGITVFLRSQIFHWIMPNTHAVVLNSYFNNGPVLMEKGSRFPIRPFGKVVLQEFTHV